MVAFLVFSDWFNPGDAVIELKDGTSIRGVLLQEMRDEVMVQVQETSKRARAGDHLVLEKNDIVRIEEKHSWVITVHHLRWIIAGIFGLLVLLMAWRWLDRDEIGEWMSSSWDFAKLLIPLLFGGVFIVGFIADLLPQEQVGQLVGANDLFSTLVGSVVGALFYFATLTEIPIVQALVEHGMAKGPALSLLLAGPALSLPNILVIGKIMGWKKAAAFCGLVVVMATIAGLIFGVYM